MASGYTRNKRFRHGSVTVILTVLVIATAVLVNSIFSALAMRYGWFINMNADLLYPVSDNCFDYLDEYVMDEADDTIKIIFGDTEENTKASATHKFILNTAKELADRYTDKIEISFLNIWENPSEARSYGITASTNVVVSSGDKHIACKVRDFFVFSVGDSETPLAYMGDRRFAVAMKAVTEENTPMCYFTANHGESFIDYEIMYAATDAGYTVSFLDTLTHGIPEDCAMLVTYNPAQDLTVEDNVSGISEVDMLNECLENGGRYAVFLSADTFVAGSLDNLEGFLADWGVTVAHETGKDNIEECTAIRDPDHALSVDGYTIIAEISNTDKAESVLADVDGTIRVSNATVLNTAEGYVENSDGSYSDGNRTVSTLLRSHAGAESWAGGRATGIAKDGFSIMTLTEQSGENPSSLLVCSSTEFASEKTMQSAVYANKNALLSAFGAMGKDAIPLGIGNQPFADSEIRILTTSGARNTTIALVAIPSIAFLASGLIILLRRRYS